MICLQHVAWPPLWRRSYCIMSHSRCPTSLRLQPSFAGPLTTPSGLRGLFPSAPWGASSLRNLFPRCLWEPLADLWSSGAQSSLGSRGALIAANPRFFTASASGQLSRSEWRLCMGSLVNCDSERTWWKKPDTEQDSISKVSGK